MTVHPLPQDASVSVHPDADTTMATTEPSPQEADQLEQVMLAQDKIYVVLAVVLLIWFGIVLLIYRTDRRVRNLERKLEVEEQT